MVELSKELIDAEKYDYQSVAEKLYEEKNELEKKIYMLNILTTVDFLENLVIAQEFQNTSIKYFQLSKQYNSSTEDFDIKCFSLNKNKILIATIAAYEIQKKIEAEMNYIVAEENNIYISNEGIELNNSIISANKDGLQELYNFFLNEELRTSLHYSQLNNTLHSTNNIQAKKNKI